jgi:hypothetical protein
MRLRRALNGRVVQWVVWRGLPRLIGEARTRQLVRRLREWLVRKPLQKDKLRPDLRRQLELEFMADVTKLSAMLGRDLGQLWFGRSTLPAANASVAAPAASST